MKRAAGLLLAAVLGIAGLSCAGNESYTLLADFADVGDLVSRANVQQSDAVVGTIMKIELAGSNPWLARVTMRLDRDVIAPEGTRAVVRSTSLLGEKYIDLIPPDGATRQTPNLPAESVIPSDRTSKAPELEQVFEQLGAILASGGLADLAAFTNATAKILQDREDTVGRVLDGTETFVAALARQRENIAQALDSLKNASQTLAANSDRVDDFIATSGSSLKILADHRGDLEELAVQLDRLGGSSARLIKAHQKDMKSALGSLIKIINGVHAGKSELDAALDKLPRFASLFAAAIPGDYIQLDVAIAFGPIATNSRARSQAEPELKSLFWSAAG